MGVPLTGHRQRVVQYCMAPPHRAHLHMQLRRTEHLRTEHLHMELLLILLPHMGVAHTLRMHILLAVFPLVEDPPDCLGALHSGHHRLTTILITTTTTILTTTTITISISSSRLKTHTYITLGSLAP